MNKETLVRNFSRCAEFYDRYADIQALSAARLLEESPRDNITNILEIGCGTGNYTRLLRERFECARVKALDISDKMIEVAKRKLQDKQIEFIVGDGEFIEPNSKFDLVTSNAAFQWFESPKRAITNYKNMLTKKGLITFSIFGPLTFRELNRCMKEVIGEDRMISADNFLEKRELKRLLKAHFIKISIKELIIEEEYPSLNELLSKIKYTGARGDGGNSSFLWSRALLNKIEDVYRARFGLVRATYQIFLCKAAG